MPASTIQRRSCMQVTDPSTRDSVALMYSYEKGDQPGGSDGRIGVQGMGPGDTYICQATTDVEAFWADRNQLRLGACLRPAAGYTQAEAPSAIIPQVPQSAKVPLDLQLGGWPLLAIRALAAKAALVFLRVRTGVGGTFASYCRAPVVHSGLPVQTHMPLVHLILAADAAAALARLAVATG